MTACSAASSSSSSSSFVYPVEWTDIKLAVAVDFGSRRDPLAPVWIHFHTIDGRPNANNNNNNRKNAGTKDFDNVHAVHEQLGFGSMITQSYQEYQYLLNVVELPVTFVDERHLPRILLSKEASRSSPTTATADHPTNRHSWMIETEDEFNSNWNEYNAPNAYYRSYRLARQMEHLKKKMVIRNTVNDMNNDLVEKDDGKSEQQREFYRLFENLQFKLTVS